MTSDTVPIMALSAAMVLALLLVAIELRDIKARLDRHRRQLNGHHRSLVALKGAPMPPARVSPEWQERWHAGRITDPATWADVLPPNHVLPGSRSWGGQQAPPRVPPVTMSSDRPKPPPVTKLVAYSPAWPDEPSPVGPSQLADFLLDRGPWAKADHGDTLTMPSRDTMRLATTTARIPPSVFDPPADVLDALHRSGHPMTRRELAEVLERSDWELTAELRDLIHAGRITVASTAHNTEAAYIPTTTGVPR